MSDLVVIGVDPGNTTGVFIRFRDGGGSENQLERDYVAPFLNTTFGGLVAMYGTEAVHIAIERYIITARTSKLSQQPDALEVTGIVKCLAQIHGVKDVRQYMKANLKFAQDMALKRAGWYNPKMRHANDAARQAFALLKDVDYPTWLAVSNGAMMKSDDERT